MSKGGNMPDRRQNKLQSLWNNGWGGKVMIFVMGGIILSLVTSVITLPIIYETKAESKERFVECQEQLKEAEERSCKMIYRLEILYDRALKEDQKQIDLLHEEILQQSKLLQRIDERTLRMDKILNHR